MKREKTQMKLAVLIPNYSRRNEDLLMLQRAIHSIRQHEPRSPVLVVDDGSPHVPSYKELVDLGVSYFPRHSNGGYSAAINSGLSILRQAGFTHVLTMNSDVELTAPFKDTIERAMGIADIVGGRLLYPTGRVQAAGFEIDEYGRPLEIEKGKYFFEAPTSETARYCVGVTGALQAFSLEIGNYSEMYGLGFEDVEFCVRAWTNGYRVAYIPQLGGVHYESETRGREPSAREIQSMGQWMTRDFPIHNVTGIKARIHNLNEAWK